VAFSQINLDPATEVVLQNARVERTSLPENLAMLVSCSRILLCATGFVSASNRQNHWRSQCHRNRQFNYDETLQRITLTCGRGARVSIEESVLPRASTVHNNK
jgi:hypothetical protein